MDYCNWQTLLSSVKERTKYAWKNSLFCDVAFTVNSSNGGRQETLQANKYMLAISSPVFEAMFYGELAENNSTIHLPDCTREGLQQMLQYIHSDEIDLTGNNVMEVLYVAEKYIIPSLVKKCKDYLQKSLTPEEVFIILPQKLCYEDEELKKHCWEIIDSKTKQAVFSEPFLNVSQEILCQVLERDTLRIKELELFQAVDKWASKRLEENGVRNNGENKREVLGNVIKLIRFPVMKVEEFAQFVLPCEILEKSEITEILQTFYNITKPTLMFNIKRRIVAFTSNLRFGCIIKPLAESQSVNGRKNAIRFKTDKSILLVGFRMFGRPGIDFSISMEITKSGYSTKLSQLSSTFTTENEITDDTYHGFTVMLNQPLQLEPNEWYRLNAVISGPPTYAGKNGKSEVVVEDPYGGSLKVKYKSDSEWTSHTSIDHGQFPAFIFRSIED